MPPLHPPPAAATAADVDAEATHMRTHNRDVFLDLIGDAHFGQGTTAIGTVRWQRHVDRFVDAWRRLATRVTTVASPDSTTRFLRLSSRRPLRERRRLSLACTARSLEFLFQPLVFTAEPLDLASKPLILPAQIVRRLRFIRPLWVVGAFRHAPRYARIACSVQEGTR